MVRGARFRTMGRPLVGMEVAVLLRKISTHAKGNTHVYSG